MDGIIDLTTINYTTFALWVFMILIGGKQIIELKDYYKKRYRIKTGIDEDKESIENRINTLEKHDKWQYNEISKIANGVEKIEKQLIDKSIDDWRYEILSFCTDLTNGKTYNKEAFEHIQRIFHKYEDLLIQQGMKNGLVDESMKYINEIYHEKLRDGF